MKSKTPLERYIDDQSPPDRRQAYLDRQKERGYRFIKLRVHQDDEYTLRQYADALLNVRRAEEQRQAPSASPPEESS